MSIRTEIAGLTAAGVSEVVLVAQDLASYGRDLFATPPPEAAGGISDLLRFVSDVEGLRRLRLYYLYPREIRPELIATMVDDPVVADYFDLSLQHATGRLLRAMKRPGNGDAHLALIESIRSAAPAAAMRSSFIVGFPGETEADVEELAAFLEAAQLDWGGFFPYSAEEGTSAADLDGRIDDDEVGERLRYLQGIQEEITASRNAEQVGTVVEVLVDQVEDGTAVGRSFRQAPEIDGVVLLDAGVPGEWLRASVTGAYGTDLDATVVGPA